MSKSEIEICYECDKEGFYDGYSICKPCEVENKLTWMVEEIEAIIESKSYLISRQQVLDRLIKGEQK